MRVQGRGALGRGLERDPRLGGQRIGLLAGLDAW